MIAVSKMEKTKRFTVGGKCGGGSMAASQPRGRWDGFGGVRASKAMQEKDGAKLSEGAGEGLWKGTNQIFHTVLLVPGLSTGQSAEAPAVTLSCRRAGVILSRAAHSGTLAGLFRRLKACV